jgi:hypothetical protein
MSVLSPQEIDVIVERVIVRLGEVQAESIRNSPDISDTFIDHMKSVYRLSGKWPPLQPPLDESGGERG